MQQQCPKALVDCAEHSGSDVGRNERSQDDRQAAQVETVRQPNVGGDRLRSRGSKPRLAVPRSGPTGGGYGGLVVSLEVIASRVASLLVGECLF